MQRNNKTEEEKKLMQFMDEYETLQQASRTSGTYIDIEPYQHGWSRTFVLRDDIKNRSDVQDIRQLLDIINTTIHSHRKDFTHKDWKTKRWIPIKQTLKWISADKYEKLSEKHKSFFGFQEWYEPAIYNLSRKFVSGYVFRYEWHFVFNVTPRMVTQRWIPDAEIESLLGEMESKIRAENLWPKVYRARSKSGKYDSFYYDEINKRREADLEKFYQYELDIDHINLLRGDRAEEDLDIAS